MTRPCHRCTTSQPHEIQSPFVSRCRRCHALLFAPRSGPATLLVSEDDEATRRRGSILVEFGCDCVHVTGEDEALAFLKGHTVDVVVVDIGLAAGTGVSLLENISKMPAPRPVKLMVASVHNPKAYRRRPQSSYSAHGVLDPGRPAELLPALVGALFATKPQLLSGLGEHDLEKHLMQRSSELGFSHVSASLAARLVDRGKLDAWLSALEEESDRLVTTLPANDREEASKGLAKDRARIKEVACQASEAS